MFLRVSYEEQANLAAEQCHGAEMELTVLVEDHRHVFRQQKHNIVHHDGQLLPLVLREILALLLNIFSHLEITSSRNIP